MAINPIDGTARYAKLRIFCQKVLPAVFDDSLAYYEVVCKLANIVNGHSDAINGILDDLDLTHQEIEEIKKEFEDFKTHGFDKYYKDQVEKWIKENLDFVFNSVVSQVFFGLTQDGYFVAYVPDSWDDIIFDTGWDYSKDTYGRLILRWNVDSVHSMSQYAESVSEKPHGSPIQVVNKRPVV